MDLLGYCIDQFMFDKGNSDKDKKLELETWVDNHTLKITDYTLEELLALAYCDSTCALQIFNSEYFRTELKKYRSNNKNIWSGYPIINIPKCKNTLLTKYKHILPIYDLIEDAFVDEKPVKDPYYLFLDSVVDSKTASKTQAINLHYLLAKDPVKFIPTLFNANGSFKDQYASKMRTLTASNFTINRLLQKIFSNELNHEPMNRKTADLIVATADVRYVKGILKPSFLTRLGRKIGSFFTGGAINKYTAQEYVKAETLVDRIRAEFNNDLMNKELSKTTLSLIKIFLNSKLLCKEYWRELPKGASWNDILYILTIFKEAKIGNAESYYNIAVINYKKAHNILDSDIHDEINRCITEAKNRISSVELAQSHDVSPSSSNISVQEHLPPSASPFGLGSPPLMQRTNHLLVENADLGGAPPPESSFRTPLRQIVGEPVERVGETPVNGQRRSPAPLSAHRTSSAKKSPPAALQSLGQDELRTGSTPKCLNPDATGSSRAPSSASKTSSAKKESPTAQPASLQLTGQDEFGNGRNPERPNHDDTERSPRSSASSTPSGRTDEVPILGEQSAAEPKLLEVQDGGGSSAISLSPNAQGGSRGPSSLDASPALELDKSPRSVARVSPSTQRESQLPPSSFSSGKAKDSPKAQLSVVVTSPFAGDTALPPQQDDTNLDINAPNPLLPPIEELVSELPDAEVETAPTPIQSQSGDNTSHRNTPQAQTQGLPEAPKPTPLTKESLVVGVAQFSPVLSANNIELFASEIPDAVEDEASHQDNGKESSVAQRKEKISHESDDSFLHRLPLSRRAQASPSPHASPSARYMNNSQDSESPEYAAVEGKWPTRRILSYLQSPSLPAQGATNNSPQLNKTPQPQPFERSPLTSEQLRAFSLRVHTQGGLKNEFARQSRWNTSGKPVDVEQFASQIPEFDTTDVNQFVSSLDDLVAASELPPVSEVDSQPLIPRQPKPKGAPVDISSLCSDIMTDAPVAVDDFLSSLPDCEEEPVPSNDAPQQTNRLR